MGEKFELAEVASNGTSLCCPICNHKIESISHAFYETGHISIWGRCHVCSRMVSITDDFIYGSTWK